MAVPVRETRLRRGGACLVKRRIINLENCRSKSLELINNFPEIKILSLISGNKTSRIENQS
jgi:hypothetical protein